MEAAFEQVDQRIVGTARTFGAGPWRTFLTVTLALVRPSLIAGVALTWARALGEFGATIAFAGNTPGKPKPCHWLFIHSWNLAATMHLRCQC